MELLFSLLNLGELKQKSDIFLEEKRIKDEEERRIATERAEKARKEMEEKERIEREEREERRHPESKLERRQHPSVVARPPVVAENRLQALLAPEHRHDDQDERAAEHAQRGDLRRVFRARQIGGQVVDVAAEPFAGEILRHLDALGMG